MSTVSFVKLTSTAATKIVIRRSQRRAAPRGGRGELVATPDLRVVPVRALFAEPSLAVLALEAAVAVQAIVSRQLPGVLELAAAAGEDWSCAHPCVPIQMRLGAERHLAHRTAQLATALPALMERQVLALFERARAFCAFEFGALTDCRRCI